MAGHPPFTAESFVLDMLEFLLFDWLRIETLLERPRFKDHSRDTSTATLGT